jgi:RHS repeat-associated protein
MGVFSRQIESRSRFLKKMRKRHPDYLPHNELITDRSGNPYQYFHYTAWGESFAQAEATQGSFSSSYRFNAKELDQETGNYYYGARYYHPKWSVWLGVDEGLNCDE